MSSFLGSFIFLDKVDRLLWIDYCNRALNQGPSSKFIRFLTLLPSFFWIIVNLLRRYYKFYVPVVLKRTMEVIMEPTPMPLFC